ncbi:MAG: ribonuclease HI family protein [Acidobacteriota bacterium]|nr:ribonuclease HI family protein [Acidobacteriota bacterium]
MPLPEVKIFIDGGARGNPGPSGYGVYVVASDGTHLGSYFGYLGVQTNNVAEYHALLAALEHAGHSGWQRLWIGSDSELLVKQFRGEYRVKNEGLKRLYDRCRELARHFEEVSVGYLPRKRNAEADALANRAMNLCSSELPPGASDTGDVLAALEGS